MSEIDVTRRKRTGQSVKATETLIKHLDRLEKKLDGEDVPAYGRGGTNNFPNAVPMDWEQSENIKRIGKKLLQWYRVPFPKSDEEVRERLASFFEDCFATGQMATWEKAALAVGADRATLTDWEKGRGCSKERSDLISKARELCASFEAEMAMEGRITSTVYMFRAKNYFGLKDRSEYHIEPGDPLGDLRDPEEIRKRLETDVITVNADSIE